MIVVPAPVTEGERVVNVLLLVEQKPGAGAKIAATYIGYAPCIIIRKTPARVVAVDTKAGRGFQSVPSQAVRTWVRPTGREPWAQVITREELALVSRAFGVLAKAK